MTRELNRRLQLTFETIDDLGVAAQRGTLGTEGELTLSPPEQLGPLVEWMYLRQGSLAAYRSVRADESSLSAAVAGAMSRGSIIGERYGAMFGTFPLSRRTRGVENQLEWIHWCSRSQQAAELAGVPKALAQGLIGALRELEDNVHEHSYAADTGIAGYRANLGTFEFVVGDAGIGVLASLRLASEFEDLRDAGQALRIALSDGVSRFGRQAGRGYGFRPLFKALAGHRASLRFRSGDHALTLEGSGPTLSTARVSQKASLSGFVISVTWRSRERAG